MSKPHILLGNVFFSPFSYGGATVVAEEVARDLVARDAARVSAVSLMSRAELAPYTVMRAQNAGVDNYMINMPAGRGYEANYDNPEVGRVFDELIADLAPDLMHLHCIQEIGVDALRAAKRANLPTILSVHDFWWICERQFMIRMDNVYCAQNPVNIDNCKSCVGNWEAAKARLLCLHGVAKDVDMITYPSHFARELSEASGLAPGRGVVWGNGVHLPGPDFAAAQAARRARDPRLVFGFVGGPSQIKGWPIIRKAFQELGAEIGRDDFIVQVVDGSMDGSWWRGIDLSDLPGEWQVVPRFKQAQMDQFYAGIDVLLFMSQWKETFGLAIREALARGIRVIQTESGGTTEHGAAHAQELIPIGAGSQILMPQLDAALSAHPAPAPDPVAITGFGDQAREFEALVARVLASAKG
ncbi:glycosyltransferase [Tropicibacter sp. R15_0]|uniref:glycosyltransferase n=1 Tax=Tropicibacter sp. R15_0 TaxID=2821101 RepID=UPI001ADCA3DD|nr:glycosyltransferase [Tropicibacter sp. R15_0]MBO9468067.1 glycosyltransferase [Tropicibacter sp. R15_0]